MDDSRTQNFDQEANIIKKVDQKLIFQTAFDYVKSRTNKKIVTIADVLFYFLQKNISNKDKINLGWLAINMIEDRQKNMNMTDQHKKMILDKIIEIMFIE